MSTSVTHTTVGDMLECRDAGGQYLWMEAVSGLKRGRDFLIVWVRRPGHDERIPWPADAIRSVRRRSAS